MRTCGKLQQLLQFFVHVAQGMPTAKAARKVGYSEKWAKQYSYEYVKKYRDYVTWLQAHFAQEAAKRIPVDQETALEELEKIAMTKVEEYRILEPGKDNTLMARWKTLAELTPNQLQAVEPVGKDGWKFRDRDGKLSELLKTMGLLNEKVILEHRHRHLHVHTDLSKVPMKKLEALESQYEALLLKEATQDDYDNAVDTGVERPAVTNGNGEAH